MIDIKKFMDGSFYDTINEKIINNAQLAELFKKGEQIKVTFDKTGKDITESIIEQLGNKVKIDDVLQKTTEIKSWLGDAVNKQVGIVLEKLNFPTSDQIANLDETIKALTKSLKDFNKKEL